MAKTSLVEDVATVQGKMLQPVPAHFKPTSVTIGINDCFGVESAWGRNLVENLLGLPVLGTTPGRSHEQTRYRGLAKSACQLSW